MTKVAKVTMLSVLTALAVALTACSGGSDAASNTGDVRTVEIRTLDTLAYAPSEITVKAGETVRFVVSNPGSTTHEFIVGDEEMQMGHEEQMSGGAMDHGSMDGALPALTIEPGQSKTVDVTFDEAGTVLYGCHVSGHYEGGMVGTIHVT